MRTATPEVKREASPAAESKDAGSSATSAAIAEARKRIEAMKAKAARSANPYLATGKPGASLPAPTPSTSGAGSGIHPLLAQNDTTVQARSGKDRYKPMAPKFATLKANIKQNVPAPAPRRPAATQASDNKPVIVDGVAKRNGVNPYYDHSITGDYAPKERNTGRQLKFNQNGKFTRLAEQMRQEQKLEALKARIAEASKKAGLEGEIESGALIKRPPPPDVEWWDSAYLPSKSYDDVPGEDDLRNFDDPQEAVLKRIDVTSISLLVQHPIPIPAPGDKLQQAPKALFLTKKEQKKLRRNRRAAEHKDQQDRIRMGLAPPPPDKGRLGEFTLVHTYSDILFAVKISNMYRVLTQEAVSDPTKVEARVRKEMLARQTGHDKANAERKLTDEQRKEKIEKQKEADESKGIYGAVFKVRYLSDGGHKFKVKKNAEQNALTGVLIFNPKFNLVYVEGGQKGVRAYIRLMTERIKWTEASAARGVPTGPDGEEATPAPADLPPVADGETEEPHNLAENYCHLVWEGQQKERLFRGFRPKRCPTDFMSKEFLGEQQGLWDVAKRFDPEAEGA